MARCLTGESSLEEAIRWEALLAADADLKADFETLKLLMFDKQEATDRELKNKFNRISRRLEDEGLM